ncbi:hypothetical protein HN51_031109, partial [Arachis hypogaea]
MKPANQSTTWSYAPAHNGHHQNFHVIVTRFFYITYSVQRIIVDLLKNAAFRVTPQPGVSPEEAGAVSRCLNHSPLSPPIAPVVSPSSAPSSSSSQVSTPARSSLSSAVLNSQHRHIGVKWSHNFTGHLKNEERDLI